VLKVEFVKPGVDVLWCPWIDRRWLLVWRVHGVRHRPSTRLYRRLSLVCTTYGYVVPPRQLVVVPKPHRTYGFNGYCPSPNTFLLSFPVFSPTSLYTEQGGRRFCISSSSGSGDCFWASNLLGVVPQISNPNFINSCHRPTCVKIWWRSAERPRRLNAEKRREGRNTSAAFQSGLRQAKLTLGHN